MRHAACALLVLGAVFACSDDRDGFNRNITLFVPDAGADIEAPPPTSCEGTLRCGRNLRSVVDGCDESKVIAECAPDQGCAEGKCVAACSAAVGADATIGCDFIPVPPPPNALAMGSCFAAVLANTWEVPTKIEAEYNGAPLDVGPSTRIMRTNGATTTYDPFTGELPPGEVAVVFLSEQASSLYSVACPSGVTPAVRQLTSFAGTRRDPTFRIKTTAPVSAYGVFPFAGAASQGSSATMLLPVSSWKRDYLVTSAWEMRFFSTESYFPTTHIVAAEDETDVTLVGSVHIQGGANVEPAEKGTAKTYRLRRGEQIQFSQEQDLTGSHIGANKPIGVWVGHQAMAIPTTYTCCGDISQTALFPLKSWGHEYPVVPYRSRRAKEAPEDYLFKVTGAVNGTVLTYEPIAPKDAPRTLEAGQSILFTSQEPFVVKSQGIDHPIAVFSYMTGEQFAQAQAFQGDPEFVPVVASEQYLGKYVFFVDTTHTFSQLVVVRSREANNTFAPVVLDCAGELGDWSPLGSSGAYEYTRVWLTKDKAPQTVGSGTCGAGRHVMESKGAFGVTVWGTAPYASYGYPGGAALRGLNTVDPIVN
jgi:hypothetical protein